MGLIGAFLLRNWQHLLIGALILFAIWKIDQNGYNRAKSQAEAAERARQEMESRIARQMEKALSERFRAIEGHVSKEVARIDAAEGSTRTIIQKEIRNDPRLSDPARGMSDELRAALDRAACASHPATADCHK